MTSALEFPRGKVARISPAGRECVRATGNLTGMDLNGTRCFRVHIGVIIAASSKAGGGLLLENMEKNARKLVENPVDHADLYI